MTVLTALQSASVRLAGQKPDTFFSTTNTLEMELADLATEAAIAIAKAHDWRAITKLATLDGDATTTAFDLPPDYDRMPIKAHVWSTSWIGEYFQPARDLDQWHYFQQFLTPGTPGYWIVLDGDMQIFPAMSASEQAKFYYITDRIVRPQTGENKAAFTADADTFLLPERLLTLAVIWRWRAQKRLEYAEDMKNFEVALSEEISRDRGSQIITVGKTRFPASVGVAYPGELGS